MTTRRQFIGEVAAGIAGGLMLARHAHAQQRVQHDSIMTMDSTNLFPMQQDAWKPVTLPARAGAVASMSDDARDALEHQIRCQCGCTLDVYTCRTTDFSCRVSPAMHRDVAALVQGGYTAQEIIDAFVHTYGERVLMAPTKTGFNLVGWALPSFLVVCAGVVVATVVRRWATRDARNPAAQVATPMVTIDATPEELARLEAAIRSDD